MIKHLTAIKALAIAALTAVTVQSCSTPKHIAYMEKFENAQQHTPLSVHPITAQPDDKLSIIVNTDNPALSEMFNLATYSYRPGYTSTQLNSRINTTQSQALALYTVDPMGDIQFPILGKLHIAGMSRSEIAQYITHRLEEADLAKKPVVTVEFVNAAATIAGEVARPGTYTLDRDYITLPQLLGDAGDLTIQGRRDNILVVRIVDGKTTSYRVDLSDGDALLQSPAYYIRQNDYIYVEPNNMKKRSSTVNGNNVLSAPFWVSIASLLTSVAVLIFK